MTNPEARIPLRMSLIIATVASVALLCASCGSSDSETEATSAATTAASVGSSSSVVSPSEPTSSTREPQTSSSAVIDTAADESSSVAPTTAPPPTAVVATTTVPLQPSQCTENDLMAMAEPLGDSAMSNTKLVIDVTNSSEHPCLLPATPPTLAGVSADGTNVPLPSKGDGTYFGTPLPLVGPLAPGSTAVVWIGGGQPGVCDPLDATQIWSSMVLGLPDGGTLPFTTSFDTKCGVDITTFGTA